METGFLNRSVRVDGIDRRFVVYVPFEPRKTFPAMLHLHGMGESGSDGLYQLWHGAPRELLRDASLWPMIVICPQKAKSDGEWFDERPMLDAILKAVETEFEIDPHRRYLAGLSQGGRGTMRLAKSLRWQFAALAVICGWVDEPISIAKSLNGTPVWLFHGEKDEIVPVSGTKDVARELEKLGSPAKTTLYPDGGHFIWDRAFGKERLAEWLLKHSLD